MATSHSETERPNRREVALLSLLLAATAYYVLVYGGPLSSVGLFVLYAIGLGVGLFTLYLFYRFVVAVETIAEKH